jgi:polysaccharide biosynthesis/export protein
MEKVVNILNFRLLFPFLLCLILLCLISGCATRSYTTAHSEVVADAISDGTKVRSVAEEKRLYEEYERNNREKILSLIGSRTKSAKLETSKDYRIGPSDKLEINVIGIPELNTEVRVSQSGFITLPMVGSVKLEGQTEAEAEATLRKSLLNVLRRPEVGLSVIEFGSQLVTVLGAVKTPGNIPLKKGNNSLVTVIGAAGGLIPETGNFVTIIPVHANKDEIDTVAHARYALGASLDSKTKLDVDRGIEIPLDALFGINGTQPIEIPVLAGDTVMVSDGGQVLVEGEVERRGAYELGGRMTLLGALAAAGGVSYGALLDEIEVIRKLKSTDRVVLLFDLEKIESGEQSNPLLRNGDIVRVPTAEGKRFHQDIVNGIQRMINVGGNVNPR